jgi:hypothetical protein
VKRNMIKSKVEFKTRRDSKKKLKFEKRRKQILCGNIYIIPTQAEFIYLTQR